MHVASEIFSCFSLPNILCIGIDIFKNTTKYLIKQTEDKIVKHIPYRTNICCRTKLSTFWLGVKNFVRQKFYPIFQYKSQEKIGQNCRNFSLVSKILSNEIFCPTKFRSIRYYIMLFSCFMCDKLVE